jgi:hypothetical protein
MTSTILAFLIAIKPFFLAGTVPTPDPVVRASVVVETSSLREAGAGPAIALRVRSSAAAMLHAALIDEGGGPGDPVVAVTVRALPGRAIGYDSTVAVLRAGRQLVRSQQRCSLCTESELVVSVERSLARLTPRLRELAGG